MMPNMSGMHVHQVLSHSHPELAERMIFITGGAFTDAARAFLEQTDNICLEKPLDWHRLDELLAAHM